MSRKKIVLPVFVLLLIIAGALFYLVHQSQKTGFILYGNVDIREVQLSFRVGGKLAEMNMEEGTHVKAGDKLAALDHKPYQDKLEAAKAQAQNAKANLDKLLAGARQSEIDAARAQLSAQNANLKNVEQQLVRVQKLRKDGTVSQSALDQAIAQHDMAQANVEALTANLALLEEGSRKEDIAAGQANFAAAQAEAAAADIAFQDTSLYAPSAGIIRNRLREMGAIVGAGEPIYVLALKEPLRVRAYIGEPDLGRIHLGQKVFIHNDTMTNKAYSGTIGFISPTAEFTPKTVETPQLRSDLVYRFWITLDPTQTGLLQGMPVTITVTDEDADD